MAKSSRAGNASSLHAARVPLNDGVDMPALGLAAFRSDDVPGTKAALNRCIKRGIRHIEIADMFSNGSIVAECIGEHQIPREEFFITFKIWPKDRTKDELVAAFKEAVSGMPGLGYVDLCMVHAPIDPVNRSEHWKALEVLKGEGLVRSLGLAYMTHIQLGELIKNCNIIPTVLEMSYSPFCRDEDVIEFCGDNGIAIMCDDPYLKFTQHRNPQLLEIARDVGANVDELLIRYMRTRGAAVLLRPSHILGPDSSLTTGGGQGSSLQQQLARENAPQSAPGTSGLMNALNAPLSVTTIERLDALHPPSAFFTHWDPKEEVADIIA